MTTKSQAEIDRTDMNLIRRDAEFENLDIDNLRAFQRVSIGLKSDTIYLTDNGAALCGEHLGASARMTGRDISGQPIEAVTPDMVREAQTMGWKIACEKCGKSASLLHV